MKKKLLTLLIIAGMGLTGCSATKPKPFQYKEWHNVQTNEYGQKCTYHEPKSTEFEQNIYNEFHNIVGGTLRAVLNEEVGCYTLSQWNGINQQANTMVGLVNSFKSIQGQSSIPTYTYTPSSNAPSAYNSSFGNTYQYDLSNPLDRVRYNSDPSAQLRDRVAPNPYKNIESNTLQQGGGIYPTNNSPAWTPVE